MRVRERMVGSTSWALGGRLLNLFQEHVGGALKHAIHVFDDDDAPRRGGGHLLGGSDDLTHLIDTNSHLVRGQHRDIRMRAGKHLLGDARGLSAHAVIRAFQRRRECSGHVGTARSGRSTDQPRLGDLARVALRDTTEHVDYRLLAD